jgi:hypothetical protein
MRRRQIFSGLNARDNRAPVPSGAGMGAATASQPDLPSPVSREEEKKSEFIWLPVHPSNVEFVERVGTVVGKVGDVTVYDLPTPSTDPMSNAPKKRGWPKGKKRKP